MGKHPLSNTTQYGTLAGFNTLEVLGGEHRVVFRAQVHDGVGVIEVIVGGPRRGNEVDTAADALVRSRKLTDDEATQLWDALHILDIVAERVGLDSWDYRPEPADPGHQKSAVAAGVLPEDVASLLFKDEIMQAMSHGWGADGNADQAAAIDAALRRARGNSGTVLTGRTQPRCNALMPRAKKKCIRREHHPGAHRSGRMSGARLAG